LASSGSTATCCRRSSTWDGRLALTAGWAIGRPFGVEPHCLVGVVLVLATPTLVDTQPGGAYNDVTSIALVLSAPRS
jgi:hypothetical protein